MNQWHVVDHHKGQAIPRIPARKVYKVHASGILIIMSVAVNIVMAAFVALTISVKKFEYHFFLRPFVEAERNKLTMELNNAMEQAENLRVQCANALEGRKLWKGKSKKGGTRVSPSN